MSWLLDTNVISETTRRRPAAGVIARIAAQPPPSLFTMSVVVAELRAGIDSIADAEQRRTLGL